MRVSEAARRYARAAYDLALENKSQDSLLNEVRELDRIFSQDKETKAFLTSPMVKVAQRLAVLDAALKGGGVSGPLRDFVFLLARKNRLGLFGEIAQAIEQQIDAANNVSRGTVRSAVVLEPKERQQIEAIVEKQLNKKVIMIYKVDPTVIGGLVAEVGSFTFDDSLQAHLRRLNEELSRQQPRLV